MDTKMRLKGEGGGLADSPAKERATGVKGGPEHVLHGHSLTYSPSKDRAMVNARRG